MTPGIALAPAATEELAVDAPSLVTLGGDHVQSAALGDVRAQADIRPPPGHVRRDGDAAWLAGPGDDLGFFPILTRVQHLVREPGRGQEIAQTLRRRHGARAHENGPS